MLDAQPIEALHASGPQPLPTPRELKSRLPLTRRGAACVARSRREIRDLLHGRDRHRVLVIAGPCSIHDADAALEYGARLRRVADARREELVLVMRTFIEKPRTTVGWRGLLHDPHLDGSGDVGAGLGVTRELLVRLCDRGVPCASEILDPFTPPYVSDLLSWAGIGARTSESQTHRLLASALEVPVGFKNGTDGSLRAARDAVVAAGHAHRFLGIDADGRSTVVQSRGNPDRHVVLRGGEAGPNYDARSVARAAAELRGLGVARPVMVDCAHGNSGRDPARQASVCREVLDQLRSGAGPLLGLLLESHLEPGRQDWHPGAPLLPGVSITDPCMGWTETEELLHEIADAVGRTGAS